MSAPKKRWIQKGRGALDNPSSRFAAAGFELDPEFLEHDEGEPEPTRFLKDTSKSVVSRNSSPDIPFDVSLNPYRGCEHGCSYCMAGDTPILMADGTHKPLGELRNGDQIYGTRREGHYRRLVITEVLDHWSSTKVAYRVTLADGTELVASGDHRFLTERGWKHVTGAEQGRERRPYLTRNDKLMGFGHAANPAKDLVGLALKSTAELKITAIESLHEAMPMYDITTGTGDFIANGIVSHNCYARPSHEYLGFSAGLDFERLILVKEDAPKLLEKELRKPSWEPKTMLLSGITDPYQPIERKLQLTRRCLEVLCDFRQPVSVITKNHLVTRDIDLLAELAQHNAAHVTLSITTLNEDLRRVMEPRTATGMRRIDAVRKLSEAGIPVSVNIAPVVPGLNDGEIPAILEAVAEAGARSANFILLRLPGAVEPLFVAWLEEHFPDRKERVLNRLREARGGKLNESAFGKRMRGSGPYAESIRSLFHVHQKRLGLDERSYLVSGDAFRVPGSTSQPGLFE